MERATSSADWRHGASPCSGWSSSRTPSRPCWWSRSSRSTPGSDPQQQDIIIGVVAGLVGMVSVALFYQGLALGRMGVVAPITAVVSAIVPVAWGLAFGERPSALALLGVALAVGSVALISSQSPTLDHAPETKSRTPLLARDGRGPGIRSVLRLVLQHQRTTRGCGRCSRRGGHRPSCSPSSSPSSPACAVTLRLDSRCP